MEASDISDLYDEDLEMMDAAYRYYQSCEDTETESFMDYDLGMQNQEAE